MEMTIEKPTTEIETRRDMSEYFAYWKSITRDNACLSPHIFLLHDLILNRDPKKGAFSPITSKNKLNNGCTRWQGLASACSNLGLWLDHSPNEKEMKLVKLSGLDVTEIKARKNVVNYGKP